MPVGLSLKFCFPVFANFSSFPVSFSAFVMNFNFLIKNVTSSFTKYRASIPRSSHRRCSVKKCVLKNFPNFTGKPLCWSLFLINCRVKGFLMNNYLEEHLCTTTSASQVFFNGFHQKRNTAIFRIHFNVFTSFIVM